MIGDPTKDPREIEELARRAGEMGGEQVTSEELERLEALLAKATPGPWRGYKGGNIHGADVLVGWIGGKPEERELAKFNGERWAADTDLIVALRNLAPALIAGVRERASLLVDLESRELEVEGFKERESALRADLQQKLETLEDRDAEIEILRGHLGSLSADLRRAHEERDQLSKHVFKESLNRRCAEDAAAVVELERDLAKSAPTTSTPSEGAGEGPKARREYMALPRTLELADGRELILYVIDGPEGAMAECYLPAAAEFIASALNATHGSAPASDADALLDRLEKLAKERGSVVISGFQQRGVLIEIGDEELEELSGPTIREALRSARARGEK